MTNEGAAVTAESIYANTLDNSARFLLGTEGENPLIVVGVNPSTAAPGDLDLTVTKVTEFARRNDFDSWVMLNLYPQRSTDPTGMHDVLDPALQAENERHIAAFINGRPLTILAAWGELMDSRPYLPTLLAGILTLPELSGCTWMSIDELTATGHPRHPSRAGYDWPLRPFDVVPYLAIVTARAEAKAKRRAGRAATLPGHEPHAAATTLLAPGVVAGGQQRIPMQ